MKDDLEMRMLTGHMNTHGQQPRSGAHEPPSPASAGTAGYAYYLVWGRRGEGWYIVGVKGFDPEAVHGFIVAASDPRRVGTGAIEWVDAVREGWETRYHITQKPLPEVIAEAEALYA